MKDCLTGPALPVGEFHRITDMTTSEDAWGAEPPRGCERRYIPILFAKSGNA